MSKKLYPFSMRKHAHDLMFRRNRAMNELWSDEVEMTEEESRACEELIDKLAEITLHYQDGNGIVWLNGKDWALAQESVAWAESTRAELNACIR